MAGRIHSVLFVTMAIGLTGCSETPGISVQQAPDLVIEEDEFAGLSDQSDAMLTAQVPLEQDVWVFKLSGATEEVRQHRDAFNSFIASLNFDSAKSLPDWELPNGWEKDSAPASQLRAATIRIASQGDGEPLELTVSRLPQREDWLHYRLRNFNRWRRQLQLPVAGPREMMADAHDVAIESATKEPAFVMLLVGSLSESARTRMAGRGGFANAPPRAEPPSRSAPPKLTYEAPERWREAPPRPSREVTFLLEDGGQQAEVAVSVWPARAQMMADPLANVNRWRRNDLGLEQINSEELADMVEPIVVNGTPGLFVAMNGEAGNFENVALRSVMVIRGDFVWFFKMLGSKEVVENETETLRAFVESAKFQE